LRSEESAAINAVKSADVTEASDGGRAQTPDALVGTHALKTDRLFDPRFGAAHAETSSDPLAVFAKLLEAWLTAIVEVDLNRGAVTDPRIC